MIKDFLRRKEIVEKAGEIAGEIMSRFPASTDQPQPGEGKVETRKRYRKLAKALKFGRTTIRQTAGQMRLGIYGKAKLCKSVQDLMLKQGYSEEATRMIIEELAVTV